MKKTFRYMAAAAAALAAVSCAKQEINTPEEGNTPTSTYQYILNVTREGGTKTTMDGNSILWSADDQIGVSCTYVDESGKSQYGTVGKSNGVASITDADYTPSTSATFTFNLTEGYTPHSAGYPYKNPSMKITSGGGDNQIRLDVEIAAQQIGIPDNIPAGALAMVGKITDGECQMFNVGAVIKFEITKENITSLKFEGNNSEIISGERYYYVNSGEFAYEKYDSDKVTVIGTTSVTLVPEGDVFEVGTYYFVVSPNDLTEGFTMTLTTIDGQTSVRKTSTRFNIERNHKYTNFGSDNWAIDIATGAAGNLGSADGTTATLYAIVSGKDIAEGDTYGFEISSDGEKWTKYDGAIGRRTSVLSSYNTVNVLTAPMTGLVPDVANYYRAYYTTGTGATTYGTIQSFKTYANAETATIDLYNGWDSNYWPFTNITAEEDIYKGTSWNATSKGTEFTMMTTSGHEFTATATGGVWLGNSNGCLTMKVSAGDYLQLPSIEGKKPISVTVVAGNTGGSGVMGYPSIGTIGTESSTISGGGQWAPDPNYKYNSYTWTLVTASEDLAICFNRGDNCYISYLEVVYVNSDIDTRPAVIEQNLIFSTRVGNPEGEHKTWPFSTEQVSYKEATSPIGPFCTTDQPDIEYYFHVSAPSSATDNWRTTGGQGLRFGGTKGDYMRFCPVTDYKLTKIKIRGGNQSVTYSVTDANGQTIEGGETTTIKTSYDSEVSFTLSNTVPATEYRLVLGSQTPSAIREMWITYELVQ